MTRHIFDSMDRMKAIAPPERAIHHILLRLWQDLLGVWPIGIHDDFFDLDGHSLTALL